jgi:hypothetical protein
MEPVPNRAPKYDYPWEKALAEGDFAAPAPSTWSGTSTMTRKQSKDYAPTKTGRIDPEWNPKGNPWEASSPFTGEVFHAKSKKAAIRKARKAGK